MRVNAVAPPITGDVFRITVTTISQAQLCQNTFDYMSGTFNPALGPIMSALITDFLVNCQADYKAALTASTVITEVSCACISRNDIVTAVQSPNQLGVQAGNPLPLEMAAILRKRTDLKGQHGLGRVYMPAVAVAFTTPATDPNVLNVAAGIVAYDNLAGDLELPITAGATNAAPCVSTRPTGGAHLVTRAALITSITTEPLLGTNRRRREGRGK